jgi:hypothetical protein
MGTKASGVIIICVMFESPSKTYILNAKKPEISEFLYVYHVIDGVLMKWVII